MSAMKIDELVLGPISTNVYVISDTRTRECVVIDPAAKPNQIAAFIEKEGLIPKAILITHGHFDHILAVSGLREMYPELTVYAHEGDREFLLRPHSGDFRVDFAQFGFTPDVYLKGGEKLELAGFVWEVYSTPGHSAGSVCYYIKDENTLFAGDTVFCGTYGRCDLETGSIEDMVRSYNDTVFRCPDETKVYSGHGSSTTIEYERSYSEILNLL